MLADFSCQRRQHAYILLRCVAHRCLNGLTIAAMGLTKDVWKEFAEQESRRAPNIIISAKRRCVQQISIKDASALVKEGNRKSGTENKQHVLCILTTDVFLDCEVNDGGPKKAPAQSPLQGN